MRSSARLILTALLFVQALPVLALTLPPNDGYVTDSASNPSTGVLVLTAGEEAELEAVLKAYAEETSNEIAILILRTLEGEAIAEVAVEAGREWGVGTSENDNGILILYAHDDREVFIATGYGLEGAVPDIVAKGIIEEEMIPHFRDGEEAEGFRAAIDALKKHIGGEYTADRYSGDDGGALPFLLFFFFIFADAIAAFFGRTKSWWLGGIVGGVLGLVLTIFYSWWLTIPLLALIGLVLDYVLSQAGYKGGRGGRGGFWTAGGRGGGSGGFGGFGGGSFGGGGAGGKW